MKHKGLIYIFLIITFLAINITYANANSINLYANNNTSDFDILVTSDTEYLYELNVGTSGTYIIETDADIYTCDTLIILLDSQGNYIAHNDDNNITYYSLILTQLSSSKSYYLYITTYENYFNDGLEPLNCTIRLKNKNNVQNYYLNELMYLSEQRYAEGKLTVSQSTEYVIETGRRITGADTVMYLYDSNYNLVDYNDDIDYDQNKVYSKISRDLPRGTYYIKIRKYNNLSFLSHLTIDKKNTTPDVYLTLPYDEDFILQGDSQLYQIVCANADSVNLSVEHGTLAQNGGVIENSSQNTLFISSNDTLFGNTYLFNATITQGYFPPFYHDPLIGSGYYNMPELVAKAFNNTGNNSDSVSAFWTIGTSTQYSDEDETWSIDNFEDVGQTGSPRDHGTIGVYNCLAYSVGVTDNWEWPFDIASYEHVNAVFDGENSIRITSYGPLLKPALDAYMGKTIYTRITSMPYYVDGVLTGYIPLSSLQNFINFGTYGSGTITYNYNNRSGKKYTQSSTNWMSGTKIIYYEGDHFSIPNSTGTEIVSKWGGWELIRSTDKSPFESGGYGSSLYYYK